MEHEITVKEFAERLLKSDTLLNQPIKSIGATNRNEYIIHLDNTFIAIPMYVEK